MRSLESDALELSVRTRSEDTVRQVWSELWWLMLLYGR